MKVLVKCHTYNHERYIEDALKGFVMQKTDFEFLALIIDDCSTDRTADIVRSYELKYPGIVKGIYLQENYLSQGKSKSTLTQAYEADAEYIALCEGDDFWTDPLKLQKQVDALDEYPDCTICFGRVKKVRKDGSRMCTCIPKRFRFRHERVSLDEVMRVKFLRGHGTFQTSSFVFRTSMYEKKAELMGSLLRTLPYGDLGTMLACLLNGDGIMLQDTMSCYRVLSGGYMSRIHSDRLYAISEEQKMLKAMRDFKEYFGHRFENAIFAQEQRSLRKIRKLRQAESL